MLDNPGKHISENGQTDPAAIYFKKALEAQESGNLVKQSVMRHESLSAGSVREQAGEQRGSEKSAKSE